MNDYRTRTLRNWHTNEQWTNQKKKWKPNRERTTRMYAARCCSPIKPNVAHFHGHTHSVHRALTHTHAHGTWVSQATGDRWRQLLLVRWESNRMCCVIDCDLCGPNIHCTESRWKSQSEHISSKRLRANGRLFYVLYCISSHSRSITQPPAPCSMLHRHNRVGVFRGASFNTLEKFKTESESICSSKHVECEVRAVCSRHSASGQYRFQAISKYHQRTKRRNEIM